MNTPALFSRRQFLAQSALAGAGLAGARMARADDAAGDTRGKALIAITQDCEMSRNFPTWETTHWDYEKGNLNEETERYCVAAARRVKARGGRMQFFLVGRVLEQKNIDWIKEIIAEGHHVGNHSYDHINVMAKTPQQIQFRFQRAPWLIEGMSVDQVLRKNIRMTSVAMRDRLGINPNGFRTPGGYRDGLDGREDLQRMVLDLGFTWVSSKAALPTINVPGARPTDEVFDAIVKLHPVSQPYVYPTGLIEVPMNPISDINAYRTGRWNLEEFLRATRQGVEWAIENRAVFDLLTHPSVEYVMDPEFRTIDMICDLVEKAGDRAAIVGLDTLARRANNLA